MKIQATYFEVDNRFVKAIKAFSECLRLSTEEKTSFVTTATKMTEMFAPVVLRVDKRLGFDLVLVVPEVSDSSLLKLRARCFVRNSENQTLHEILIGEISYNGRDNLTDTYLGKITKIFANTKNQNFLKDFSFDKLQDKNNFMCEKFTNGIQNIINSKIENNNFFILKFPRPLLISISRPNWQKNQYATVQPCRVGLNFNEGKPELKALEDDTRSGYILYEDESIPEYLEAFEGKILLSSQQLRIDTVNMDEMGINKLWKHYIGQHLEDSIKIARLEALSKFKKNLHSYSLEQAENITGVAVGDVYNWLIANDDHLLRALRTQAIESFPGVIPYLIKKESLGHIVQYKSTIRWRAPNTQFNADPESEAMRVNIMNAIDNSEPLLPILMEALSMPAGIIKSIPRNAIDEGVMRKYTDTFALLRKIAPSIPKGHWPQVSSGAPDISTQWKQFLMALWNLYNATEAHNKVLACSLPDAILHEYPWWNKKNTLDNSENFYQSLYDIEDMVQDFTVKMLFPIAIDILRTHNIQPSWNNLNKILKNPVIDKYSIIVLMTGKDRTLGKISELSDKWHKDISIIEAKVIQKGDTRTWVPLFEPLSINQYTATCLVSAVELSKEGLAMEHCVGSYVSRCQDGSCHIISLTDQDKRVSTIELYMKRSERDEDETEETTEVSNDLFKISLQQNQGVGNSTPDENAIQAGTELVDWLNANPHLLAIQEIKAMLEARRLKRENKNEEVFAEEMTDMIGYNPFSPEGRDSAIEAFQFMLLKKDRNLNYEQWCEKVGIVHLLETSIASFDRSLLEGLEEKGLVI